MVSLPPLDLTLIAVSAAAIALIAAFIWFLLKEKVELPLPNETDYGNYIVTLPDGPEEGRLTSARKTVEREFEIAISNAETEKEAEQLQGIRDKAVKFNLFAFKGSGKYLIFSNRNLIDEKLSLPLGRDRRQLVSPEAIIDVGEDAGFRVVYIKMPDPDKVGVSPPERSSLSKLGDALKYIKRAALNTEKVTEMREERDFYKEETNLSKDQVAELRSEKERAKRALGQKSLTTGEEVKVKGALRSRIAEFFYSGWRILASLFVGGLTYAVWQQTTLPYDPIAPALVAGLIIFFVYPYLAERL